MRKALGLVINTFVLAGLVVVIAFLMLSIYSLGYTHGENEGSLKTQSKFEGLMATLFSQRTSISSTVPTPAPVLPPQQPDVVNQPVSANWSGPELWQAVNARRSFYGVGELSQKDEVCTIASIRLNELLALGGLDAHAGFSSLPDRREDLAWIYETYDLAEFLVQGATSATEAVDLWENTLGHKKLLTGGEYVWGCTYAQNGIGVAIAAF